MIEQIPLFINLRNAFISISLDILDIKVEEDSNTNELENFNADI